ncbi:MAG: haloacid dehalogenase-like hydrolase, partial [Acidimicrobiales bacterium]
MSTDELASWRDGKALQEINDFLGSVDDIAPKNRLAVFDNDGTLWCEKPRYTQQDFLTWQLRNAVAADPEVGKRTEYQAILSGDHAAMAEMGLAAIALA